MVNLVRPFIAFSRAFSRALCLINPAEDSRDEDIGVIIAFPTADNEKRALCTLSGPSVSMPRQEVHIRIRVMVYVTVFDGACPSELPGAFERPVETASPVHVQIDRVHLIMPQISILLRRPTFPAFYAAATADEAQVHDLRIHDFTDVFRPQFVYRVCTVLQDIASMEHPSVLADYECYVVADGMRICLGVGAPLYRNSCHVVFPVYAYDPSDFSRKNDGEGGILVVPARHVWNEPEDTLPSVLDPPTFFFLFHWLRIPVSEHRDVQLVFERPSSPSEVVAVAYPSPTILGVVRQSEHEFGW